MKKVLAAAWHPGGANSISPVIQRLIEEKLINVVTLGHQFSEDIFSRNGIPFKTISDYGVCDVSLPSLHQIIFTEKPDLVLTGTACPDEKNKHVLEQSAVLSARIQKIPSLAVLGMWERSYSRLFNEGDHTGGRLRFLPNKIAVADAFIERGMTDEMFPKEQIVVTGNPYFDDLIRLKEEFTDGDRAYIREQLGVDAEVPLVLYASQPIEFHYGDSLGYTEKSALRSLLKAVSRFESKLHLSVLVKAHPRENKADLEEIAGDYDLHSVVDQDYPTREALLASDVVVSLFSTVLVESSYLDKPSISFQPGLVGDDTLMTNHLGVTVPVYQENSIGDVMHRALFDKQYKETLAGNRDDFKTDGQATNRVVGLIYNKYATK